MENLSPLNTLTTLNMIGEAQSGDHLIKQFAKVLGVDVNVLFSTVGILSEEDRRLVKRATPAKINEAFVAFRQALKK